MKKIVSVILLLSLVLGMTAMLSGCKTKVKGGTEAAKLLLANERFDENLIKQNIDLGLSAITSRAISDDSSNLGQSRRRAVSLSTIDSYSWQSFPAYNDTANQFSSFIMNIDYEAKYVAEDIANMKNNVGVIDKWVRVGREMHMLRVYDNKDVLIVLGEYDDVHVYYRYTDENANNVYEMYSFMIYDDGSTGKIRTLYIPDERYEYQFIASNGYEDCVILENSRGYWVGNRYNYFEDADRRFTRFTPIVIKDDFCYGASILVGIENGEEFFTIENYSVVDLKSGRELVNVYESGEDFLLQLHASGIKEGLVSLGSANYYEENEGVFATAQLDTLVTDKGSFEIDRGYDEGASRYCGFSGGMVMYDYAFLVYRGYIYMDARGYEKTPEGITEALDDVLEKYGLTLYRSTEEIKGQIAHAQKLADEFGEVFGWRGYSFSNIISYEDSRRELINMFDSTYGEYDEIKDNETVTIKQKLDPSVSFAPMAITSAGQNSYADGSITLSGISAQISDTTLLENGGKYTLKVALSLCDENGNPISVNTVALDGTASDNVTFNGGAINLSASGSYTVPKNLVAGDYALVVYGATADEGIRVTEMVKIGSFSTYNESLDSSAMDITVVNVGDSLHFKYEIKNSITISVDGSGKKYSASEIERIMTVEILKKGAPFSGAALEYADGGAVNSSGELGAGSYRMMCYLNTADGLAQSYIYLEIK